MAPGPDAIDAFTGSTALRRAAAEGSLGVVTVMLRCGVSPDHATAGTTPLITAALAGRGAVVAALLAAGASPNLADTDSGETPLMAAAAAVAVPFPTAMHRPPPDGIVNMLLEAGADPNQPDADAGFTALMAAAVAGNVVTIEALVARGADPNQSRVDNGETPLILAARHGHIAAIRSLVAHGGDPHRVTRDTGATALMSAADAGHADVITLLLKLGADPNQTKTHNGCTSLMNASLNGHIDASRLLLAAGADPNTRKTYSGWTAAMYAAQSGHLETLKLLATFGADLSAQSAAGHNARGLAADGGHPFSAGWLDAVDGWSPLCIAMGCRLGADARVALRLGQVDPSDCAAGALVATAGVPSPWGCSAPVCPAVLALAKVASRWWSPRSHQLHHKAMRSAVSTVMLVMCRLRRTSAIGGALPILPDELWFTVLGVTLRRWWSAMPIRPTSNMGLKACVIGPVIQNVTY